VRLDFAGAWTDVAPFANVSRGVVVNAAINLRTRVELSTGQASYWLRADDLGNEVSATSLHDLAPDGTPDLLKAAIRGSGLGPCHLLTSAEAPPGSGLGTSGALSVALIAAIAEAHGQSPRALDIAHQAWQLETVDAAVPGGQQDQYAAASGGFQRLVFDRGVTSAFPIRLEPAFAEALARHTIICFTGRSRFSGDTITRVMNAYVAGDYAVAGALDRLVEIAERMADALRAGSLAHVGKLLAENWQQQQRLAPGMCTDDMTRVEAAVMGAGGIGGKAAGAGAGGTMFFVVPGDPAAAKAAAAAAGATILPTAWADRGVSID
jgi:D-glycero-alpha-D-manno-heptose-7-phosphate kinase